MKLRLARIRTSDHAIAAGFAAGAASSMTPFLGFHFLIGFALAFLVRGNMLSAAIGTVVGNPLTFPIFFSINFTTGTLILGALGVQSDRAPARPHSSRMPAFRTRQTIFVGSIPLAAVAFAMFYLLVRWLLTGRARRKQARRTVS